MLEMLPLLCWYVVPAQEMVQWCQTAMEWVWQELQLGLHYCCWGLPLDRKLLHCCQETRAWMQALPPWLVGEQAPRHCQAGFGPLHSLRLRQTVSPVYQDAVPVQLTQQPVKLQRLCQPGQSAVREHEHGAVQQGRC